MKYLIPRKSQRLTPQRARVFLSSPQFSAMRHLTFLIPQEKLREVMLLILMRQFGVWVRR